ELLVRSCFEVHWTGVGPDGGRDLVVVEKAEGMLAPFQRKWLVSCKHYANSGKSVGLDDVSDINDACDAVGASGFLLVCSTQPSSTLVRRFEEIEARGRFVVRYWDSVVIEKQLFTPQTLPLVYLFFPASAKANPWHVYATYSPSFWAANYKDYLLYLGSRTAHVFPSLSEVEEIVRRIESIKLPEGTAWERHYLRPRAVYFDDKHAQFSVFADYLYPEEHEAEVLSPADLNEVLRDGMGLHDDESGMWYLTHWDIRYVPCNQYSDHFHVDHKHYYEPFMAQYGSGVARHRFLSDMI
ncbi:MAG TPA: restriction endonuclease, partial [Phycisphaerae bacterium]|nr:restriction endonuclease [Phycisphaerae bacterium]